MPTLSRRIVEEPEQRPAHQLLGAVGLSQPGIEPRRPQGYLVAEEGVGRRRPGVELRECRRGGRGPLGPTERRDQAGHVLGHDHVYCALLALGEAHESAGPTADERPARESGLDAYPPPKSKTVAPVARAAHERRHRSWSSQCAAAKRAIAKSGERVLEGGRRRSRRTSLEARRHGSPAGRTSTLMLVRHVAEPHDTRPVQGAPRSPRWDSPRSASRRGPSPRAPPGVEFARAERVHARDRSRRQGRPGETSVWPLATDHLGSQPLSLAVRDQRLHEVGGPFGNSIANSGSWLR